MKNQLKKINESIQLVAYLLLYYIYEFLHCLTPILVILIIWAFINICTIIKEIIYKVKELQKDEDESDIVVEMNSRWPFISIKGLY